MEDILGSEFWEQKIQMDKNAPVLKIMKEPCDECAVVCGFYLPFTENLKLQSKAVQIEVSSKWFCHADPAASCRGNWDALGLDPEREIEK